MSDKLELKDIACYLPYGLTVQHTDTEEEYGEVSIIVRLETLSFDCMGFSDSADYYFEPQDMDEYNPIIKPILRPMSDLVKPLPDGTIPIVELAKIEGFMPNCDNYCDLEAHGDDGFSVRFNIEDAGWEGDSEVFQWSRSCGFSIIDQPANGGEIVANQLALWQYLYQHHFDINDLIGRGLAIDINTISL